MVADLMAGLGLSSASSVATTLARSLRSHVADATLRSMQQRRDDDTAYSSIYS